MVRYEYTPGFEEIDSLSVGGQGHYWFGDYVKVGLTTNTNEQDTDESSLNARRPHAAHECALLDQGAAGDQ